MLGTPRRRGAPAGLRRTWQLAEEAGSVISAALFGGLAGSGALPFTRAQFEARSARRRRREREPAAFAAGFAWRTRGASTRPYGRRRRRRRARPRSPAAASAASTRAPRATRVPGRGAADASTTACAG